MQKLTLKEQERQAYQQGDYQLSNQLSALADAARASNDIEDALDEIEAVFKHAEYAFEKFTDVVIQKYLDTHAKVSVKKQREFVAFTKSERYKLFLGFENDFSRNRSEITKKMNGATCFD